MSAAIDRERLGKLLGMLGSAHVGEIVAAAHQVERLRRDAGLDWRQILTTSSPAEKLPDREFRDSIEELREQNRRLKKRLAEWERYTDPSWKRQTDPWAENDRLWDEIVRLKQQLDRRRSA